MKLYYQPGMEYEPGRHRIDVTAKSGDPNPEDSPATSPNVPMSTLEIDEKYNSSLCLSIISKRARAKPGDMPDYYIDNLGLLRDKSGVLVPIIANKEKADWVASVLAGATDAQIDTWFTNNVTTLAQARTVMAMMAKLIAWLARQAGFE